MLGGAPKAHEVLPDISNNAGSCQDLFLIFLFSLFFFRAHNSVHSEEWSYLFRKLCFDDHGSFVIFRSASVRPKHLCDPNFDHDY